jgi:Fe-S-cluster containining protein
MEIDWGDKWGKRINGTTDSCEGCGGACCIVLEVRGLEKPQGVRCNFLRSPGECTIYETRPKECREFDCSRTFGMVRIELVNEAGFEPPKIN